MRLSWSNLAKDDLRELRRYSVGRWGRDVAQLYLENIQAAAKRVGADPFCAKPLRGNFRIFRTRSHYLVVRLDDAAGRLIVARVLHVATDIERHLW